MLLKPIKKRRLNRTEIIYNKIKNYSVHNKNNKNDFNKNLSKEQQEVLKKNNIFEEDVTHPCFSHFIPERKKIIIFNNTHSPIVNNERTEYVCKDKKGRKTYAIPTKEIEVNDKDKEDILIGYKSLIESGKEIKNYPITEARTNSLMIKYGLKKHEIITSNKIEEIKRINKGLGIRNNDNDND